MAHKHNKIPLLPLINLLTFCFCAFLFVTASILWQIEYVTSIIPALLHCLQCSNLCGMSAISANSVVCLLVTVLNVNEGRNRDLMEACKTLKGYSLFVSKVRKYTYEAKRSYSYKWFGGVGKQHPFELEEGKKYQQPESVICYR